MNVIRPSGRLIQSAATFKGHLHGATTLSTPSRRTLFEKYWSRGKKPPSEIVDPTSPNFLKAKTAQTYQPQPQLGDLAPGSIFDSPDTRTPSTGPSSTKTPDARRQLQRNPDAMAAVLDPTPSTRKRWQRKMVIRDIRSRHRLSKTRRILRTERSSVCKSHGAKTSVKKLGPLARQIAGKPIEDAIVQMRFSKKKAAAVVLRHLEFARDEAIVSRGMGLGAGEGEGVVVEDGKGKKRRVRDETAMYVDQAWVGRGRYGREPNPRARGRMDVLRTPTTSITVLLKEEKTRIRLAREREEKRLRKKVWVPLPDRPITAQRQYPLW